MKTPILYQKQLKERFISKEMLSDVLFSLNKRAKNCRDKIKAYCNRYSPWMMANMRYDCTEKYEEKKEEYYKKKEELLSVLKPTCIHREIQFIDFDDFETDISCMLERDKYYLFYDFGDRSFHSPIDIDCIPFKNNKCRRDEIRSALKNATRNAESIDKLVEDPQRTEKRHVISMRFPNLEIIELPDQIMTFGEDIGDLLSCQFVNKIIDLVKSGDYTLDNRLKIK